MSEGSIDPRTAIGHVHLTAASLPRLVEFYRDVLGFHAATPEHPRGDDATVWLSADGRPPFVLGLTQTTVPPAPPGRVAGLYHAAFLLPDRPALGRLLRRLLDLEIPMDGASDHAVSEALYLRDPEGNGIELYADRPREVWPMSRGKVQMTGNRLDLDSLLAEAGDDGAGVAAGTRLGHVHLRVSTLRKAETFYHGALGFDVTQRSYSGALFMSAGGYHHHLGANVWAGEGIPPMVPGTPGLREFSIRLPDGAALAWVLDRLAARGIPAEDPDGGRPLAAGGPDGGAGGAAGGGRQAATVRDLDGNRVLLVVPTA